MLIALVFCVNFEVNAQKADLTGYYIDSVSLNYYCYLMLDIDKTFKFEAHDTSIIYLIHGSWNFKRNKIYLFDKNGELNFIAKIKTKKSKVISLNFKKSFILIKTDRILPIQEKTIDSVRFSEPVRKIWCDSLTNLEKEKVVTEIEQFKHNLISYNPLKDSSFVSYIASLSKEGLLFSLSLNETCNCIDISLVTLIYFLQAHLASLYRVDTITNNIECPYKNSMYTSIFQGIYIRKLNSESTVESYLPEDVYKWIKNNPDYSNLPEIKQILQKIEEKECQDNFKPEKKKKR